MNIFFMLIDPSCYLTRSKMPMSILISILNKRHDILLHQLIAGKAASSILAEKERFGKKTIRNFHWKKFSYFSYCIYNEVRLLQWVLQ
jgi:hypothetical protein